MTAEAVPKPSLLRSFWQSFLWWLAPPIARVVNESKQEYGYLVLRVPRTRAPAHSPEHVQEHGLERLRANRTTSYLDAKATAADIAASVEGMRSLLPQERVTLKASGDFVLACCDCGHAHRLTYAPAIDDANEFVIDALLQNADDVTSKLRREFEWPFERVERVRKNGKVVVKIVGGN